MTVFNPCDAVETKKMMMAMLDCQASVALRVTRNDLPVLTTSEGEYAGTRCKLLTCSRPKASQRTATKYFSFVTV